MEVAARSFLNIHEEIGGCCSSALVSEVYTSPKPGLVDNLNSGAHKDMDIFTFLSSIKAISPYFIRFAEIGCNLSYIDDTTLERIRPLGMECEKVMFKATRGVNTHKGAIFSLGILAVAAGYCCSKYHDISANRVCGAAGIIARAAEKDFLLPGDSTSMTKGRKFFDIYGIRGIRGEAASGFYSVRKHALPVMRKLFLKGRYRENDIYLQVLLHLMTQVVDTNVIARGGLDAVEYVRSSAVNALSLGGALTAKGMNEIYKMDKEYTERNISPGGCADLLSISIALYELESLFK